MDVAPVTYVVVHGLGGSGPDHWQTRFAAGRSDVCRVEQTDWDRPRRRPWVKALAETIAGCDGKVVLIAHSLGVMTIVHWAAEARDTSRVAGALLVAPPDVEAGRGGVPPHWVMWLSGWAPIPMRRLPFRASVVSSADDPTCSTTRARAFASAWGASFLDLGLAGHVNPASGYGPWRGLERLLATTVD